MLYGVPTVVEAATIAADSLDLFISKIKEQNQNSEELNKFEEQDKYTIIKEILSKEEYNFIVTPKEIDELIESMSNIISQGINSAVQD